MLSMFCNIKYTRQHQLHNVRRMWSRIKNKKICSVTVSWHHLPKNRAGAYFNLNYNNFVPIPSYDNHGTEYLKKKKILVILKWDLGVSLLIYSLLLIMSKTYIKV